MPLQQNGYDCALYTCRFVYLMHSIPLLQITYKDISEEEPPLKSKLCDHPLMKLDSKIISEFRQQLLQLMTNLKKVYQSDLFGLSTDEESETPSKKGSTMRNESSHKSSDSGKSTESLSTMKKKNTSVTESVKSVRGKSTKDMKMKSGKLKNPKKMSREERSAKLKKDDGIDTGMVQKEAAVLGKKNSFRKTMLFWCS